MNESHMADKLGAGPLYSVYHQPGDEEQVLCVFWGRECENPRTDSDMLTEIVGLKNSRHLIGDRQVGSKEELNEEIRETLAKGGIALTFGIYEHSGLALHLDEEGERWPDPGWDWWDGGAVLMLAEEGMPRRVQEMKEIARTEAKWYADWLAGNYFHVSLGSRARGYDDRLSRLAFDGEHVSELVGGDPVEAGALDAIKIIVDTKGELVPGWLEGKPEWWDQITEVSV